MNHRAPRPRPSSRRLSPAAQGEGYHGPFQSKGLSNQNTSRGGAAGGCVSNYETTEARRLRRLPELPASTSETGAKRPVESARSSRSDRSASGGALQALDGVGAIGPKGTITRASKGLQVDNPPKQLWETGHELSERVNDFETPGVRI